MGMHANARLHPNPPHACVCLGSGTRRGTSCVVMHRFSAGKHWCWWNFCLRALCADKALKGLSGQQKNVHACARLDREVAHTYTHLPPNTAHACARLTLVCAHACTHGSGCVKGGGYMEHCPADMDFGVSWTYTNTSTHQSNHKAPSPGPHAGGINAVAGTISGTWRHKDQSPPNAVCSPMCSICREAYL